MVRCWSPKQVFLPNIYDRIFFISKRFSSDAIMFDIQYGSAQIAIKPYETNIWIENEIIAYHRKAQYSITLYAITFTRSARWCTQEEISMICQPNSLSVFLVGRKSFLHPFPKVTCQVGTSLEVLEVLRYFLHTCPFAKSAKQLLPTLGTGSVLQDFPPTPGYIPHIHPSGELSGGLSIP